MSEEKEVLEWLKKWLAKGCTIRATDPAKPFLCPLPDGSWESGLTITSPE